MIGLSGLGLRGLSHKRAGLPAALIQYLHNGLTSPDSLTTGPLWVPDHEGTLVSAGADRLAVPGMRLDGETFIPTDTEGTALYPSQQVRTRNGTVTQYTGDYRGMQVSPAMTNKCTCRKVNPVDTTNVTLSGDAAAVLSVVDYAPWLAMFPQGNGKVYKCDNLAGVAAAYMTISGTVGNLNIHACSLYLQTSAAYRFGFSSEGAGLAVEGEANAAMERVQFISAPDITSRSLRLRIGAGGIAYFILPELIESPYILDSPVVPLPADDALTSYTRAATVAKWNSPGLIREQNCAVWGRVVPGAGGQQSSFVFSTTLTPTLEDYLGVYAVSGAVRLIKRLSSTSFEGGVGYSHAANTTFEYQAFWSDKGISIRVKEDGGAWSAWATNANTDPAPIASTFQIGARNGANQFAGTYPFTATAFLPTQATLADYQEWIETNTQWNVLGVSE